VEATELLREIFLSILLICTEPIPVKLPLPISVPIVSCNEELNLQRCLSSLRGLAQEIIVVDSGSTDGTRAVAESFGAQWSHQDWLGFRDQKNVALAKCTQPWVLALDCDEALSPELFERILQFFSSGEAERFQGASFPRKVHFLGRWITHGDWYPDRKLRLVKRPGALWGGSLEHDRLELPTGSQVLSLKEDLHHYSFPNVNRYISKINVFGDAYLQRQLEAGDRWNPFSAIFRPFWRFFRAYVLRRGFLDGFPGFWIAISTAYQAFVRHSRLYEWEKTAKAKQPSSTEPPAA
jgi:glycosyltransferase involved in cell wall biosynthesis